MKDRNYRQNLWVLAMFILLGAFALAGCAPAQTPAPTAVPPTETAVPTQTTVPTSTETPVPTLTSTPEPTATATETPLPPLAVVKDGFRMWCLPDGLSRSGTTDETPQGGWDSSAKTGVVSVLVPAQACTFVFTLNQPAPQGLKMQILPANGKQPWLEADLKVSPKNPAVVYAQTTHAYVVAIPYWQVTYPYAVVGPDGSTLGSGEMNFYRSYPGLCWDGSTPVPVTNYCVNTDPKEREPHPEDPDYKMVTPPAPGG